MGCYHNVDISLTIFKFAEMIYLYINTYQYAPWCNKTLAPVLTLKSKSCYTMICTHNIIMLQSCFHIYIFLIF